MQKNKDSAKKNINCITFNQLDNTYELYPKGTAQKSNSLIGSNVNYSVTHHLIYYNTMGEFRGFLRITQCSLYSTYCEAKVEVPKIEILIVDNVCS